MALGRFTFPAWHDSELSKVAVAVVRRAEVKNAVVEHRTQQVENELKRWVITSKPLAQQVNSAGHTTPGTAEVACAKVQVQLKFPRGSSTWRAGLASPAHAVERCPLWLAMMLKSRASSLGRNIRPIVAG